jgi:hypothetical protein
MQYIHEYNGGIPMDFFQKYPNKIKVVDVEVDVKTQMEYFTYLSEVLQNFNDKSYTDAIGEQSFDANATLDDRKRMLTLLSCSERVEVLRALEHYAKSCPDELKDFVAMCVYQCRTSIESELLDERHALVVSGMGGKENKVRYFAALATLSGETWSATKQHLLREELALASKEYGAEVELLEFSGKYAKMLLLTPITQSPATIVRDAKNASNALGAFISRQEVITNVSQLSDEKLDEIFSGE